MPFIGNQPAEKYSAFQKQDFTTSATTSYTLDHPVANENEIALFINFVRQEPTTAYTASGTSLTLTSATASSDDMYCVFLGKAVQTVNPPSGSVGLSQLSATGTKDSTTFLRGDNTFATAGGNNTPAFQATLSSNQTISHNTDTIVAFDSEEFDTDNAYDTSTYRFTPQSAGKYLVYANCTFSISSGKQFFFNMFFKKNGARSNGSQVYNASSKDSFDEYSINGVDVVTLNGSTDYIQVEFKYFDYTSSGSYSLRADNADGREFTKFGAYKLIGV
jgi:hypothetical protein